MNADNPTDAAEIPLRWVGPIRLAGPEVTGEVDVPLATYETPLWPSVARGARVSMATEGIRAVVVDERMTRSVLVEAPDAAEAVRAGGELLRRKPDIAAVIEKTSRHLKFLDLHVQHAANLLFVRLEGHPGDASGHNMLTRAAEAMLDWILREYPALKYVSISGNYCTDKKPSAVNGILGRGRHVIAELTVPRAVCERLLKTTPEKIADLNLKKNLIGTMLAGGLRSANAHFANMLLAFYLATGQDAANIVEGSQGLTHAEARGGDLYFSVSLPHLIVGIVGSGKDLDFVRANLERLGCAGGGGARRLAVLCAAAALCGELSLLAAQTNPGELMRAHLKLERKMAHR